VRRRDHQMMSSLSLDTVRSSDQVVVSCAGELDIGHCAKLIEVFDQILTRDVCEVLVDLQELTFIDSTGIGCLLHGALKAEKMNISFEIIPSDAVKRFVDAAGLTQFLRGADGSGDTAGEPIARTPGNAQPSRP
jgi:anti-anti-sigma factor